MKMKLSWKDVERMCFSIAAQIDVNPDKPGMIVPVVRGGMVPAGILSEMLGISCVRPVRFQTRNGKSFRCNEWNDIISANYNVLVVDDILDSGKTFDIMKSWVDIRNSPTKITWSALMVNIAADAYYINLRDVVCAETFNKKSYDSTWVDFPWEVGPLDKYFSS